MRKFMQALVEGFVASWRGVDQARRFVVNVVFLVLLGALISWLIFDDRPEVAETTALELAPYGDLVEQLSGDPQERAVLALLGERRPETLMKTMLDSLEAAREDDRVEVLLLDLGRLGQAGLSKLQTLRVAIEGFKQSGKRVIATGDYYSQAQYYLASSADEIYLHPMGIVLITGYGSYRNYFKEALDRLEVDWRVFRVGEYKSAVEPYLRNDMSAEAREARSRWLEQLWHAYVEDVENARGLEPGSLEGYASGFAEALAAHGGDAAALAKATGLVDHVAHRDEVRQRLIDLVGEDEEGDSFRRIDHQSYLRADERRREESGQAVAVVVAKGGIYDGKQAPGAIGGESTARLIRTARESEEVKALVLRVDSPGGSAFASEIIRREVALTREAGKPVVVSMSSVAASGGYWISMSADEIWAAPTSLTGSIGIYAMLPTFSRTLENFGIRNDGVGTGELAGTLRPERDLPEQAVEAMELLIQQGYRDFVEGVAQGRRMSPEEVDSIARGRVWSGVDAHELGLVDHLGGLDQAVEAAAQRAGLDEEYRVDYLEQELSWKSRFLGRFLLAAAERLGPVFAPRSAVGLHIPELRGVVEAVSELNSFADPSGLYAYCFCEPN